MSVIGLIFFLICFGTEIGIMYSIISSSKRKILYTIICSFVIILCFSLVYIVGTVKGALDIAKYVLFGYGGLLLLLFIVGNIVLLFSKKVGENIVAVFWPLTMLLGAILFSLLPPFALFTSIGIFK